MLGARKSRTVNVAKQFVIFGTSHAKGTPKMILACELYGLNMNFLIKTWSLLQLGDFVVLETLSLSETATGYMRMLCLININSFIEYLSLYGMVPAVSHTIRCRMKTLDNTVCAAPMASRNKQEL